MPDPILDPKMHPQSWCTGVTGGRESNSARVQGLIKLLREVTADTKSVAVGFGVSGPKQVPLSPAPFTVPLEHSLHSVPYCLALRKY